MIFSRSQFNLKPVRGWQILFVGISRALAIFLLFLNYNHPFARADGDNAFSNNDEEFKAKSDAISLVSVPEDLRNSYIDQILDVVHEESVLIEMLLTESPNSAEAVGEVVLLNSSTISNSVSADQLINQPQLVLKEDVIVGSYAVIDDHHLSGIPPTRDAPLIANESQSDLTFSKSIADCANDDNVHDNDGGKLRSKSELDTAESLRDSKIDNSPIVVIQIQSTSLLVPNFSDNNKSAEEEKNDQNKHSENNQSQTIVTSSIESEAIGVTVNDSNDANRNAEILNTFDESGRDSMSNSDDFNDINDIGNMRHTVLSQSLDSRIRRLTALVEERKDLVSDYNKKQLGEETIMNSLNSHIMMALQHRAFVPISDHRCSWNYWTERCEPPCECTWQYKFGDLHPGRSCRIQSGFGISRDSNRGSKVDVSFGVGGTREGGQEEGDNKIDIPRSLLKNQNNVLGISDEDTQIQRERVMEMEMERERLGDDNLVSQSKIETKLISDEFSLSEPESVHTTKICDPNITEPGPIRKTVRKLISAMHFVFDFLSKKIQGRQISAEKNQQIIL